MTQPPSDPTPAIPGAAAWQSTAQIQPPTFTSPSPQPSPTADSQQFELAGWGARFGATLLDVMLRLLIAASVATIAWVLLADHPFSWAGQEAFDHYDEADSLHVAAEFNLAWLIMSAVGLYFASALVYAPITMKMWRGATPGKRATGIRVIRADGRDLSFGHAFVREPLVKGLLINWIAGSFFLPWLLNYLWPLWDAECRAGQDFIARTRVVRAR